MDLKERLMQRVNKNGARILNTPCWEWTGCKNIDMYARHRDKPRIGELNGRAKLTADKVVEIRKLYKTGKYTQQKLADMYSVSQRGISFTVRGEHWK
jgi:hypothetical protein